jgi:hypothetical protein
MKPSTSIGMTLPLQSSSGQHQKAEECVLQLRLCPTVILAVAQASGNNPGVLHTVVKSPGVRLGHGRICLH